MSRYIDADELCEALLKRWDTADKLAQKLISEVMADVVTPIVVGMPYIDIVRCKECKRANYELSGVYCGLSDVKMGEDGFCSIGERSDNE